MIPFWTDCGTTVRVQHKGRGLPGGVGGVGQVEMNCRRVTHVKPDQSVRQNFCTNEPGCCEDEHFVSEVEAYLSWHPRHRYI